MADDHEVSVSAWYGRGWETFKAHPGTLIGAMLLYFLVSLIGVIPVLGWIALIVILPALVVGWYNVSLNAVRGMEVRATGVFDGFSRFGAAWVTYFLFAIIVTVGMVLLIVPGVIFSLMYCMWAFAVMDRGLRGRAALSFSNRITKGYKGKLFGAGLLAILLCLATIITLGLGLIVVGPWVMATFAAAYDSLVQRVEVPATSQLTDSAPGEAAGATS